MRYRLLPLAGLLLAILPADVRAQACTFTLSRASIVSGPEPVSGSATLTASSSTCAWTASSSAPWVWVLMDGLVATTRSGTGTTTFWYSLNPNTTGATRTATISVAGLTIAVTQQATPCVASLSPSAIAFPYPGFGDPAEQYQDVTVTAPADCHWSLDPWPIYVSPGPPPIGNVGSGVVHQVGIIAVPPGGLPIVVAIGSVPLTLTRLDPPCVFSFSPPAANVSVTGGSGTVALNGTGTDCRFVATVEHYGGFSVTPTSGTAPATLTYTFEPSNTDYPRHGYVKVPNASFTVTQNGAPVKTDVTSVTFGMLSGGPGGAIVSPAEEVQLTIDEQPSSVWTAVATDPWIKVTPAAGAGPALLRVSIDTAAVPPPNADGYVNGSVRLAAAFVPSVVRNLSVSLSLKQPGTSEPPRGAFDTPAANAAGLSGAIPVTGWAVDDIDVQRVQIFRDAVADETGPEIYVGEPVRVKGARPDVAIMGTPQSRRAGWGLMLLSNVLPGGGNGVFTLSAYVDDVEGHRVLLGRKTVTFDNASALQPFGTIDVPAQGASVSGTIFNQGWVLTPAGKSVPLDGSTIRVYVDGAQLGPVSSYNHPRPDVKALFPALANSDGPAAQLAIDTTRFADGIHTIAWGVTDDAGVPTGIGSRYFWIQNGVASQVQAAADARTASELRSLPVPASMVWARTGVDEREWGGAIRREVRAARGERIEVFLDPWLRSPCATYAGYLLTGAVAGPLPPGASLDRQRGIFTWLPPVEFAGAHEFTFVRTACNGVEERIPLRVTIGSSPPGRN